MIVPRSPPNVISIPSVHSENTGLSTLEPNPLEKDCAMLVGLLSLSLLTAALATGLGLGLGMPLWLGLVTLPMIGSVTLLLLSALLYGLRATPKEHTTLPEGDHLLA